MPEKLKGNELVIDRLERAVRLLDLVDATGDLFDAHGRNWGDIDAAARVWAARALLRESIKIQKDRGGPNG